MGTTIKKIAALVILAGMLNLTSNQFAFGRPDNSKKIKLALLLDTSNSMDGLINQAKSQLWTIVNELAKAKDGSNKPELEIALYEYGNDRLSAREGYIRLVTPLTTDLDEISKALFSLTTNGGSEFCGEVIQSALNQLSWENESADLKLIFIAGNEPFNQGSVDYQKSCLRARDLGVVVNTIFCGNFDEGMKSYWKEGATLARGEYISIEQNRKTVFIETPYDKKIMELNKKLNDTYMGYGAKGAAKKQLQEEQDMNASSMDKEVMVKRAVSKSSSVYKNESWDLVDAYTNGSVAIDEIGEAAMPAELKGLDEQEVMVKLDQMKTEREQIQKEIQKLNVEREAYIVKNKPKDETEGQLDAAILKTVQKQAASKSFQIK